MRRIAVQAQVQLRPGYCQSVHPPRSLVPGLALTIFEIVAQARITGGVMHVLRVDGPVLGKERVTVGVFKRHARKMRIRLRRKPRRAAQRTHHTRGLVGMLTARHHHGRQRPEAHHAGQLPCLPRFKHKRGARNCRQCVPDPGEVDRLRQPGQRRRRRRFLRRCDSSSDRQLRVFRRGKRGQLRANGMKQDAYSRQAARACLPDVRHDLSGLQAAVTGRASTLVQKDFESRKIQILVQGLERAGDQLSVVAVKFGARDVGPNLESFEVRLILAPRVRAERVHRCPEKRFDFGFDDFVDHESA